MTHLQRNKIKYFLICKKNEKFVTRKKLEILLNLLNYQSFLVLVYKNYRNKTKLFVMIIL